MIFVVSEHGFVHVDLKGLEVWLILHETSGLCFPFTLKYYSFFKIFMRNFSLSIRRLAMDVIPMERVVEH